MTLHSSSLLLFSRDVSFYTDGSASAGIEEGGYVGILTTGDPEDLNIINKFDGVGRKFNSSYSEEKAVLYCCLPPMKINLPE